MKRFMGPSCASAVLFALVGASSAGATEPGVNYREVLIAAAELRESALLHSGRMPVTDETLQGAIAALDDTLLARMGRLLPPAAQMLDRLEHARLALESSVAPLSAAPWLAKAIAYPDPAPISDCLGANAGSAQALLEAWEASATALAAAKWVCLQGELVANAATACTALSIETQVVLGELERENFCLGAQRDATLAALQTTQSDVVDFINERADTVASTLATQVSLDALNETVQALLAKLTELRDTQISDDATVTEGLDDLLDDAIGLAAQLTTLTSDLGDLRFRIQVVQDNVETAQQTVADVSGETQRLALDAHTLHTRLQVITTSLSAAQASLQTATQQARDRRLAAALGDPDVTVIRYRLPLANGGELERSRELLIRALLAYESLGADTAAARTLLTSGDSAYNQGRPLDAYDAFARAYRLLPGLQTQPVNSGAPAAIMSDSFE